jgi:signal transduction histidine kinase
VKGSDSSPFNLLRYFTGASFAVVLVTTLGAGIASAQLARAVFAEMERDDASNLVEYFITEFAQDGYTRDRWGTAPIPPDAQERALSDMRNFDLTELKLLAPDGSELHAFLAPGQQSSPSWVDGLAEARAGRVALRWEAVGGWRSILFSSHPSGAIETYVPVSQNGTVVAIAKIRHNLSPVITASQKSLFVIVALSGLAGLAIFAALTLLIRRADRIIRRQHAELAAARARLEERNRRLEEMERKKDHFYAALSHDLRSPLVSAQAGHRLVLADPSARVGERERDILLDSARSIQEVLAIIGNLLDMARVEALADSLEKQPIDVKELLASVVATHRLTAAAHAVAIETSFPPEGVVVDGDRLKLVRVFANLLSNAIKHAAGRPVKVVLDTMPDGARITVHDDGPGIPVEHREAVFERFARVPGTPDDGAGLGLAIVREFVARHGGSVTCESEPGRGTSFVVDLPALVHETARLAG